MVSRDYKIHPLPFSCIKYMENIADFRIILFSGHWHFFFFPQKEFFQ